MMDVLKRTNNSDFQSMYDDRVTSSRQERGKRGDFQDNINRGDDGR